MKKTVLGKASKRQHKDWARNQKKKKKKKQMVDEVAKMEGLH